MRDALDGVLADQAKTQTAGEPHMGFWRPVPCGHPPNPIAARAKGGNLVCHCGTFVNEAPPLIELCRTCGCHVAKHVPTREELEAMGAI